ncbi:MAG: SMC family ATPase [Candidatus Thermoplasmatota archaeon]|nr:SMC family ATPase [Candidatus Thermoplasmatota archaeon]
MNLKNLTLVNFRKFKNTTIEFPDGVTGIIGLNGAGKSTIFEAVAWVLYGSVAARTPSDQIKRQNTSTTDPCRVELEFVFEGENYRIVREMKGKTLTINATATINGKIAATSADGVNQFIQKKLGLDFKSFYTSIFAKQKELNAFSSMNASERRPLILRMLGIDSLDEIIKEIKIDKKNKEKIVEKLSSQLTDEKGNDKEKTYKEEIKTLEKNLKEINEQIKKSKNKIIDFTKEIIDTEKKLKENKREYEKLKDQKENMQDKKTLFENKNILEQEIKELKNKILERQKNLEKEFKKLESYKEIDKQYIKTKQRSDELSKIIEKKIKIIQEKKTLSQMNQKDISDINSKKLEIKKLGPNAKCPTCDRTLSEQYNVLIINFDNELKNKEKEIKTFNLEIRQNEEDKQKILREKEAIEKKINYLNTQLREKEKINTTIKLINLEVKNEKTLFDKKQNEFIKIKQISFDYKIFENTKKQLDKTYESYQKTIDLFNDKKDILSDLNLELEKKQSSVKILNQEIKTYKDKLFEIERFKKQIKEEKNSVRYLGMLSDIMSDFRTFLISRVRPTLSSYASDFFSRLTDNKYSEVELDENYNLLVYDNGELYNINRFSGGEEDLANLCLRLAISEVITERVGGVFNFIILDEIFGSQDKIRRQNIMKSLNTLSGKFRQIFLITHVDDVKNDMENIIYVFENENGTSLIKLE